MIRKFWKRLWAAWRADFLSPKDFVLRALLISLAFGIVHLLGFRQFTSVLNGTTGSMTMSWQAAAVRGVIYVILYLAFILLVPTFLIAAGILTGRRKWFSRRKLN